METFIAQAFELKPNTIPYEFNVRRVLSGKSGAGVYELDNGLILKIGKSRVHCGHKTYIRYLRDICIANILPDTISPHVVKYGFLDDVRPYIVMEKVQGTELFNYKPSGTMLDTEVLLSFMKTLKTFNTVIEEEYEKIHDGTVINACHRDLHPHNIFIDTNTSPATVKFIDFDMSICPYDLLRPDSNVSRKSNISWFIKNNILSTNKYVHWENMFEHVPLFIKNDADLYQVYSIFMYFHHHGSPAPPADATTKKKFIDSSIRILTNAISHKPLKF